MNEKITMIEIFAGIGSQERAIRQLPIQNEIVATMDVDKDAILSYASMRYDFEKELNTYNFPTKEQMVNELQQKNVGFDFQKSKHTITMKTNENKVRKYYLADKLAKNLGDVSRCEKLPYADIVFHSSPCQDYSVAGKGAGGDEGSGTRSSLMFESLRLIETSKPKYVIWENVSGVLNPKHRHNFIKMLERLSTMGYESTFDLLNSKYYGIPQNRLRIFCISHLIEGDEEKTSITHTSTNKQVNDTMQEIANNSKIKIWNNFIWPEEIPLTTRLKDILEKNVDERYYLPDERIEKILNAALIAGCHGYAMGYIAEEQEPFIVASRGRNPENPSDRTTGTPTEQRLEPNFSRCTNTITSVQKDNYVCEPIIYDDYNSRIPEDQDAITTLTTNCGATAERNGVKIIEQFYKNREPRVYDEAAPTLRSERIGLEVAESFPCSTRGNQIASALRASIYKQGARNIEENVVNGLGYEGVIESELESYADIRWRIRKLTPKECFRLMGFTDSDADNSAQYVSASAQYKQAGNSICTCCLIALFSSLLLNDGYQANVWSQYLIDFNA